MRNANKYIVNKDNASWKEVDGEIVIINFETTHYYSLNKSGTFIWKLISEEPIPLKEIIFSVSQYFGQDENTIRQDVNQLISNLEEENLIVSKE